MNRFKAVLVGLDSTLNGAITGFPDETLSAACHRKAQKGKPRWIAAEKFVNRLFFWDYEIRDGVKIKHCELSWEAEMSRKHLPNEYKNRE